MLGDALGDMASLLDNIIDKLDDVEGLGNIHSPYQTHLEDDVIQPGV